jgi:hypothetical protein
MSEDYIDPGYMLDDDAGGETPDESVLITPATSVSFKATRTTSIDLRPAWNAQPPRSNPGGFTSITGTICHFVGAGRGYVLPESADHERCRAQVRGIQSHAFTIQGMSDIHYNAMVCVHGVVFEGRVTGTRSGANGTAASNATEPAVCVLLGVDDQPTARMLEGVRYFHRLVEQRVGRSLVMRPHQAVVSTSCAGSHMNSWIASGGWRTDDPIIPDPPPTPDPPAPPVQEDTIVIVIAHPAGANARFLATSDGKGFISSMTWIPNEEAMARLTPHYPIVEIEADACRNIGLIGPVPTGDGLRQWSAADFLNAS